MATLSVTHASDEPQDTLDIFGQEGAIHVPQMNGDTLRLVQGDSETVEHHPPHSNVHQPLIEQFTRAVLEDEEPAVDGAIGREVNRLLAETYADQLS